MSNTVVKDMARIRELASCRFLNLYVFLFELEQFGFPTIRAQVNDDPTIGTGGVIVGYQLSDGLKALLSALEAGNTQIRMRGSDE